MSDAAPRLDGWQILIVDDDKDSLDLLREAFTYVGAVVEATDNARDALAWLEHKQADVIVSDLSMPDMDGLQLMREVRTLPAEAIRPTPAIALTAFARDEDIHTRTAAEIFAVSPEQVSPNQRRAAKAVNFGIAYGLSPHGLSTRLDISTEEARTIIDRYFERYAGIRRYLEQTVETARRRGYVETLFGRRRFMSDLHSRNRNAAQAAERAAINMPIQGTAADLIKLAMVRIDRELLARGLTAQMLLQVHDELLLEAPDQEIAAVAELVRDTMSGVALLKVPLKVEVGIGPTWDEAH